jgi:hypothetical protein
MSRTKLSKLQREILTKLYVTNQELESITRAMCGEIHITKSQLKNLVEICVDRQDFLSRRDNWNSLECKSDLFGHKQRKKKMRDWDEEQ